MKRNHQTAFDTANRAAAEGVPRKLSGPLTQREWEALLYSATASNRELLYRLAVYHGAVQPEPHKRCPCCGREPETAE